MAVWRRRHTARWARRRRGSGLDAAAGCRRTWLNATYGSRRTGLDAPARSRRTGLDGSARRTRSSRHLRRGGAQGYCGSAYVAHPFVRGHARATIRTPHGRLPSLEPHLLTYNAWSADQDMSLLKTAIYCGSLVLTAHKHSTISAPCYAILPRIIPPTGEPRARRDGPLGSFVMCHPHAART